VIKEIFPAPVESGKLKGMIEKEHYLEIANKHGRYASWAVWAEEEEKPKSNIGDIKIFNLDFNPNILSHLNPNIIMVGLNFSRKIENEKFINFHDKSPHAHDYKIRYAFKNTICNGAYMTDIIKDFEQLISGKVISYLKKNKGFEAQNIAIFKQEINDLKTDNPLIIAFGKPTYALLNKHFSNRHQIVQVPHYSMHISKENYKNEIENYLKIINRNIE